jgi:calpain-15
LGDCWLLAAIACLSEHRGAVQQCFRTHEVNPRGRYRLRLFDGRPKVDGWVDVTVDDFIPCDKRAHARGEIRPVFSGLAGEEGRYKGHDLWVIILEKAFAKFCGSFAALEGGSTIWALRAMTGDLARSFQREGDKWQRFDLVNFDDDKGKEDKRVSGLRKTGEKVDKDDFFKILQEYDRQAAALCCSGAKDSSGLHSGHAYSILAVREVPKKEQGFTGGLFSKAEGFRLVKVRNPWGSGEWTGDWSDKSSL